MNSINKLPLMLQMAFDYIFFSLFAFILLFYLYEKLISVIFTNKSDKITVNFLICFPGNAHIIFFVSTKVKINLT